MVKGGGNSTDDSADIPFQPFLRKAIMSSSGMGREVHFLTSAIQLFFCPPSLPALQGKKKQKTKKNLLRAKALWQVSSDVIIVDRWKLPGWMMMVPVAFSSHVRIWGESSTNRSRPPTLFVFGFIVVVVLGFFGLVLFGFFGLFVCFVFDKVEISSRTLIPLFRLPQWLSELRRL